MLSENIRLIRKSKGLSQEELAMRLNVVRQTISKWEKGLSVPDSDLLVCLSETLETPVSVLLGETMAEPEADGLQAVCEKLETINLLLAQRKEKRRKTLHWLFIALGAAVAIVFAALAVFKSPYLGWADCNIETDVIRTGVHALEWLFVRIAPVVLVGAAVGAFLTRKKA